MYENGMGQDPFVERTTDETRCTETDEIMIVEDNVEIHENKNDDMKPWDDKMYGMETDVDVIDTNKNKIDYGNDASMDTTTGGGQITNQVNPII